MKRPIQTVGAALAIVGAGAVGLVLGPSVWIAWGKNREAHAMHQAHVIVDDIKTHDPSVNATWTLDDDGCPNVVIRNVFDRRRQEAILAWARAVKQQGPCPRAYCARFSAGATAQFCSGYHLAQ